MLFYEYFHSDNGADIGASHQTGWTGTAGLLPLLFRGISGEGLRTRGRSAIKSAAASQQMGGCDDSMAGPRTRPDRGCLGGPARGVPQIARPPTIDDIRRLPQHCGQEPRDHRRAPCHLGHYPAGPGHRNPYHGLGCPAHRWVHGERRDPETHPHCPGRWRGMVSLKAGPDGQRRRKKVYGKNKTEVRANPAELHDSERVRRSVHASRTL